VILVAFKAIDSVLRGQNGGFDSHTLPPCFGRRINLSRHCDIKKVATFLLFFAFSASLSAQNTTETFKSADGRFQFTYSSFLVRCTGESHEDGYLANWSPDSCEAYSPVCDVPGSLPDSQGSNPIVCFAYRNDRFRDYPAFEAAAFSVGEIGWATTNKACLSGSRGWAIDPRGTGKITSINGIKFKMFEPFSVGSGNYLDEHVYRAFHSGRCYQLSIDIASASVGDDNPPRRNFRKKIGMM
jgi:hypothetical protein